GHAGATQEVVRLGVRTPVARDCGKLADSQALNVRMGRFVVLGAGSVVADLRVRENDDLAGIGRVCKDFLIAGKRRVENDFARSLGGRTKTPALEDRSVFQGEDRRVQFRVFLPESGSLLVYQEETRLCDSNVRPGRLRRRTASPYRRGGSEHNPWRGRPG